MASSYSPALEFLQGQIERVTYTNEENGYTVAKLRVSGRRDLVTVVGSITSPLPGQVLKMKGEWANHPKFGEQFKSAYCECSVPATSAGIQKYLGSGLIKGIGPVMAKRIVANFADDTLDVIENHIEKLTEVEGIAEKRIEMIKKAWQEQQGHIRSRQRNSPRYPLLYGRSDPAICVHPGRGQLRTDPRLMYARPFPAFAAGFPAFPACSVDGSSAPVPPASWLSLSVALYLPNPSLSA